jgi:hypothetical protein
MRASVPKLAIVVLLLTAVACANATTVSPAASPSSPAPPPTDLEGARTAWEAADVGAYALTIDTQCFCAPQHYRVVVNDDGTVQSGAQKEDYLPETVEDLFDILQTAYDKGAANVEVTYNEVGVPLHIFIDRATNVVDEEMGYKVGFEDLA